MSTLRAPLFRIRTILHQYPMALDVSRFPTAVDIPPTTIYSEMDFKDSGWIQEKGREQDTKKKRKRSLPKLFGAKGSFDSKERMGGANREPHYHRLRMNSFHSHGPRLGVNSIKHSSMARVHTIETSTPTLPHFADRRKKPTLPQLAIPSPLLNRSRAQAELIFPPTPKIMDTSTRDSIKILGLPRQIPKVARLLYTNTAIFGDGVPTFSTLSPLPSTSVPLHSVASDDMASSSAGSKSTTVSSPGSVDKSLPPIPTRQLSLPPTSANSSVSFYGAGINSNQGIHPPSRNDSLPTGVGGHPTRESVSSLRGHGRRLPPPPLILSTYRHTKSVPLISPQPQSESHPKGSNTTHGIPTITVNHAAMSISSPAVAVTLLTPALGHKGTDTVILFPSESQVDQRKSELGSDTSQSDSMLPSLSQRDCRPSRHPLLGPERRVQGPRGPRLQAVEASSWIPPTSWSGPDSPQPPAPRDQKKCQIGLSFTKKHSGSAQSKGRSLLGRSKTESNFSRAQEKAWKQRPFLAPLDTSVPALSSMRSPDPWAEEDQERSAIDSRPVQPGEGRRQGKSPQSGSGSLIGSGYSYVISNPPNMLWEDEVVVTTRKSNDHWEEADFRETTLRLADLKASETAS